MDGNLLDEATVPFPIRLIIALLAACVMISAQVSPPGVTGESNVRAQKANASVEGRVTSSTTGTPLAKAIVTLEGISTLEEAQSKSYRIQSSSNGAFRF